MPMEIIPCNTQGVLRLQELENSFKITHLTQGYIKVPQQATGPIPVYGNQQPPQEISISFYTAIYQPKEAPKPTEETSADKA